MKNNIYLNTSYRSCKVENKKKKLFQKVTFERKTSLPNLGNRCFHDKLGIASRSDAGVRARDLSLRHINYLEMMAGPKGVGKDRQLHCNGLHQQTRGDAFSILRHSCTENVPVGHQHQHTVVLIP